MMFDWLPSTKVFEPFSVPYRVASLMITVSPSLSHLYLKVLVVVVQTSLPSFI